MKKVFFLVIFLLWSIFAVKAQNVNSSQFQPCLSVFMGENIFSNPLDATINGSRVGTMVKGPNDWSQLLAGFSMTNRFHFRNNVFLQTGLAYTDYTSSDFDNIDFQLTRQGRPYGLSLPFNFESLTVPFWMGKSHYVNNNCSWSVYGGISAGILMLTGYEAGAVDIYGLNYLEQDGSAFQQSFYLALNGGLEVHPFLRLSGLGLGLLAGVQVNKTQFPNPYTVVAKNADGRDAFSVDLDIHPRQAFNIRLVCSYTFSQQNRYKNKRLKKINPFSCPK